MAVILRIVLPLLVKALNEFDYIEGVLQEFAKQSAEQLDEFSLRHSVVLLCSYRLRESLLNRELYC